VGHVLQSLRRSGGDAEQLYIKLVELCPPDVAAQMMRDLYKRYPPDVAAQVLRELSHATTMGE